MRIKPLILACVLCLLLPAIANAVSLKYSYAYTSSSSNVDLVPQTSGSGTLNAVKCVIPGNSWGSTFTVTVTIDGTASTFTLVPDHLEQESDGAGQYLTGWIPFGTIFNSSIHVTLNQSWIPTTSCWATWQLY